MKDSKSSPSETKPTSEQGLANIEQALLASNQQANERLTRIDERLERTANLMAQSIENDQTRAKERDQWLQDLTTVMTSSVVARPAGAYVPANMGPTEEDGSKVKMGHAATQDDEEEASNDWFQISVAVLIAVVSLTGAIAAWRSTLVKSEDADVSAMYATMNTEMARFMSNAELYEHYRAYTAYTVSQTLDQELTEDLVDASKTEADMLTEQQVSASEVAFTSQQFFPSRYLDRDGNYNLDRELGESMAQFAQIRDTNAAYHFADADERREKGILITMVFIPITIALLFFTFGEILHPSRQVFRYLSGFLGASFLVMSVIGVILWY